MNLLKIGSIIFVLIALSLTPVSGDIHIEITGHSTVIHHCSGVCDDAESIGENLTILSPGVMAFAPVSDSVEV